MVDTHYKRRRSTSFRYVTAQAKRVAKILRRCAFVRKADYPPVRLVEFIGHYFERGRFPSAILRRLVDSLVVEPNVHGVGIDLKKLIDNDRGWRISIDASIITACSTRPKRRFSCLLLHAWNWEIHEQGVGLGLYSSHASIRRR